MFVVCILYTFFLSERDRTAYDAQPGSAKRGQTGEVDGTDVGATPRITPIQFRRGLFLLNPLIFLVSVYAVVRDLLRPPVTEEQHIVQVLGWIIMATPGLFAVVLYSTRQEKGL